MISTDRNTALLAPTLPVTFTRWINPSVLKESHLMKQVVLAVVLSTCIAGPLAAAEIRYITDEFEITMRSGTSTANNIVRMLQSGEAVTVLERDLVSKYSLVETEDNKKSYVLSRFLMAQPAARQSLR